MGAEFKLAEIDISYNVGWIQVHMAGKITIDTERCKGCGLCVAVCPNGCLVVSKTSNKNGYFPAEATCESCTGCAMCAIICPDAVIEVFRDGNDIITVKPKKNKDGLVEEKTG